LEQNNKTSVLTEVKTIENMEIKKWMMIHWLMIRK
jgi:hypothetical protein